MPAVAGPDLFAPHARLSALRQNSTTMNALLRFVITLLLAACPLLALDATLDGRITDSVTALGIEGATVTLEPVIPGTSLTAGTNPFGFYKKAAIPPAGYTLKVRHPAYLDHDEPFAPGSGAKITVNSALTPRYPGVTTFDIFAQTFCTRTMMELSAVPIRISRYANGTASTALDTFYLTTGTNGGGALRGVQPGWYTFEFNFDDEPLAHPQRPKWDEYNITQRRYLDTSHAAVAQLMPQGQTVNFLVKGLDARDVDAGAVPLDKVYAELTGVRFKLPPGFVFGVDDPEPYEITALPTRTAETGPDGHVKSGTGAGAVAGFTDLPALSPPYAYKLRLKRFGYHNKTIYFTADAAGTLSLPPEINLDFVMETVIWINVVSDEYSKLPLLDGVKVRLQGIKGTATEGIDHETACATLPADPDYPTGVHRAAFGTVLPGRYRVSVDSLLIPPPVTALDVAPYEVKFRFRGGDTIDVAVGALTKQEVKVLVEPATIHGRLFAADERATLTVGAAQIQDPFFAYRGPRYGPKVQTGITLSESLLAGQLAPGLKIVSFDTDTAGRFVAKVRPGYYGFKIPTMTDYWGSNFDWRNAVTGQEFHNGWCYDSDPAAPGGFPSDAYHSLGAPVSSGDDITLDLFVRKQRYYVRGSISGDPENPLLGEWIMANPTEVTRVSIPFSELVNGGGTVTLDTTTKPLDPFGDFGFTGTRVPGPGAAYRFESLAELVGPGTHSLSFTHAGDTFTNLLGGPPPRSFSTPAMLYPGGALLTTAIPLDYVPDSLLGNPWASHYTGTDTVKFKFYDINDIFVSEKNYAEYFRVTDLGSRLFFKSGGATFKMRSGTWTLFVTDGVKWYTRTVPSTNTGTEHVFEIHTNADAGVARPTQSYTLKVKAFADGDPTHQIGGVTVTFDSLSALTTPAGTASYPARTKGYIPLTATHPVWAYLPGSYDASFAYVGGVPEITVTIRMTRGMRVSGRINVAGFPASYIPGVEVGISNRFGSRIATLTTDADGKFGETPVYALPFAEAGFIDINHPGYLPVRTRFETNDTGTPTSPVLVTAPVELTPIPAPVISVKAINRQGPFLPGVSKSTEGGPLSPDADLLGTFTVEATAPTITITLPNYDTSSGASGGSSSLILIDSIEEVLLVDPRSYAVNPLQDLMPMDFVPPITTDPQYYDLMRVYMRAVTGTPGSPPVPNMFLSRAKTYTPGAAGLMNATGEVPLWKLPPEFFKPNAIVRTRNGAWNHARIEFTGGDDWKNLNGLRLPPWLAGVADIVGTVSAAAALTPDAAKDQMKKIMPEGLMKALPEISVSIVLDVDGFLTYKYEIKNELEDGMDLPGTGWLALLPGFEGLSVEGGAKITLEGHESGQTRGRVALNAGASAGVEIKPDVKDFIPKSLPKGVRENLAKKVTLQFKIDAALDVNGSASFVGPQTLELNATLKAFGSITGNLGFDVTDFIEKIPHVGQVVAALNAISEGTVVATATLDTMVAAEHTLGFSTTFPRTYEYGDGSGTFALLPADGTPHPLRRSYLGTSVEPIQGKTALILKNSFYLYAGIGLGLDIAGVAGAKGELRLTGAERQFPRAPEKKPSMQITMNDAPDWPLIKRIEGSINAYFTAYLDVYVTRFEKAWEFELITIDHQFNTAPFFDLVKINITTTTRTIGGGTAATFTGLAPAPIRGLYALSNYATTSAAGNLLAFVDITPGTGAMVLKAAKRSGALSWAAPVTIASGGAILRPQMVTMPGGGAMLVWTEIAPGAVSDPTPPSTLKFSTSPDGIAWSAPATIAALGGAAVDSRLFALPAGKIGLVFLETSAPPGSETYNLRAVTFTGGTWGVPATHLTDTVLRAFDAAGPGAGGTLPSQIVYVDSLGALKAIAWDGTAAAAPVTLAASGAASPLALTSGPDDTFMLASGFTSGAGLGISKKAGAAPWAAVTTLDAVTPANATLLATTVGATTRYLAAWSGGAAPATLNYAWFDSAGTVVLGPFDLTHTVAGSYRSLRALPHPGAHEATLFAQFDNGSGTLELRTFDVSATAGAINFDRDADTLDDRAELRIVDANTTDSIVSIDGVLAGADFDGDGYSNGAELGAGTDPTNPANFPGQIAGVSTVIGECHEFGTLPGRVVIFRTGDANTPLTIHYAMSGSATNGTDYTALSGILTLPVGIFSAELTVAPIGDTIAEGSETATFTILPDAAYTVSGTAPSASVTIKDLPMDEWRFANFTTAELLDPAISGDLSDAESDGLRNLQEYAFVRPPKTQDTAPAVPVLLVHPSTSALHLGLVYARRKDALDLIFDTEISDVLTAWRTAGVEVQTVSITDNLDGTETVLVRDAMPVSAHPKRFLRVKVKRYTP